MRHELSAFLRSRLTANTALDGVPSVEQADLTDTHTPCPLNACWNTPALMPATLTFTMCGTAPAGLLMRTPGRFCSSAHEIRGLKIDKTARRVYINGEEKNFTTKEFDLLTFLAQNPNHVFTKEELFREIWDMESLGDIATVTVHIKKIREKIEFNTAKPQYIETIWGVGYRFKV